MNWIRSISIRRNLNLRRHVCLCVWGGRSSGVRESHHSRPQIPNVAWARGIKPIRPKTRHRRPNANQVRAGPIITRDRRGELTAEFATRGARSGGCCENIRTIGRSRSNRKTASARISQLSGQVSRSLFPRERWVRENLIAIGRRGRTAMAMRNSRSRQRMVEKQGPRLQVGEISTPPARISRCGKRTPPLSRANSPDAQARRDYKSLTDARSM